MKKIIALSLIPLMLSASAFAYDYYGFKNNSENTEGAHDVKFSEVKWYNSYLQQALPAKGVPGKNDMAFIRGGDIITLDKDLQLKTLELEGGNLFEVDGKKLDVVVVNSFATYSSGTTTALSAKKNGVVNVKVFKGQVRGGIMRDCNYGKVTLEVSNGTINILNTMSFLVEAMGEPKELDEASGLGFILEGKGVINLKGALILDSMFTTNPERFECLLSFKDKGGFLPSMFVYNNKVDFQNPRIKVRINSKTKPGLYPLLVMENSSKPKGKFDKVTINNKKITIGGDAVKLYGKEVKLMWGAAANGKDKRTANDLILQVSQPEEK